jgi:serine phosphatase RsbU (regulator of sigma subunit)/anti-sigma regulatory factor (Ser/Thr protein kinase)
LLIETPENRDQARLNLLVRAGEIFHQSLDVAATLNNVARLSVESFSDLCIFDLIDDRSDRLFVTAAAHRDPSKEETLSGVGSVLYIEEFRVHPVVQVTKTGEPFFLAHIDEAALIAHAASRQHEQYMRRLNYRSKIVVPVLAQSRIFGALTFVRTQEDNEFDLGDLAFAIELGRRAGLAVANAKQFHREQYVAETLQRSFLPRRFPSRAGMELSAHYRPGSTEAAVGGDWYDAFESGTGEIVVTIGDVTGKGVEAARLMVLMRQAIRVAALDHSDPRKIADVCNRLLLAEDEDRLASAFIGVIDPDTGALRYVSAGHAPPMLRLPSGEVHRLEEPSAPLGAFWDVYFELHELRCPPRSMLVLYTDGLVEASRDVVAGEAMLQAVLSSDAILYTANPAEFVERTIAGQAPRDDIAVIVVNFAHVGARWQFEAADSRSAYTMRDEYFRSLLRWSQADDEQLSVCGLIFAELIGNAVRHAPGPLSASLEVRGDSIVLHVIDDGPGFDFKPKLPSNLWAESGRGLYLIQRLAQRVVVERLPGRGSHVAVTLPVTCDHREALSSYAYVDPLSPFATLVPNEQRL